MLADMHLRFFGRSSRLDCALFLVPFDLFLAGVESESMARSFYDLLR